MVDADSSTIDKISQPYEGYSHKNKWTQRGVSERLRCRYGYSFSPSLRWIGNDYCMITDFDNNRNVISIASEFQMRTV